MELSSPDGVKVEGAYRHSTIKSSGSFGDEEDVRRSKLKQVDMRHGLKQSTNIDRG